MRYLLSVWVVILFELVVAPTLSWPDHSVGEPELEKLQIWRQCCQDRDCVPEQVNIIGNESEEIVKVDIEGVQTSVAKAKISRVPSPRSWVCYIDPNREINDKNIRCILYPQPGAMTRAF